MTQIPTGMSDGVRSRVFTTAVGACNALMLILPALAVVYWVLADNDALLGQYRDIGGIQAISVGQRAVGLAITLVTLGVIAYVLLALRGLFEQFAKGEVLSTVSARLLRRLSVGVSAYATVIIFTQAAMSAVLTYGAPLGHRMIRLSISSESLTLYIVALVLWCLSLALDRAAEIRHDNSLII